MMNKASFLAAIKALFSKKNTDFDTEIDTEIETDPNPTQKPKKSKEDYKKQPLIVKIFYLCVYFMLSLFLIFVLGIWLYAVQLNHEYRLDENALEGSLWQLPSRLYARPLELYVGKTLDKADLLKELSRLGYQEDAALDYAGSYHDGKQALLIYKRGFSFWDKKENDQVLRLRFQDGKISELIDLNSLAPISITRLEPLLIASIYPSHGQDRVLVNLEQTPGILADTIIATEDRRFYSHPGVDPIGLVRAIIVGLKSGGIHQGASTITQQFVKNHYLTNERTLSRKVKEALISVILEKNYSKQQILEAYLNEIFLGQDGDRAIHGFGLASEYYFGKPLNDLGLHQIATLVALVREPGRANPFKHPDYALKRRALILDIMVERGLITTRDSELAKTMPLDVLPEQKQKKQARYYAFTQLVLQKIHEEYDAEHLAEGLNIFTTLNPILQEQVESAVQAALPVLEKRQRLKKDFLQAAIVLVDTASGEVVAIVGDRDPMRHGFNRAVQAKRQIGSLIKPIIYMAALEYPRRYQLSTMLDDSPLVYRIGKDKWEPKNYSRRNKGMVMLIDALVHSYNIPTARVALDIGIHDVLSRLADLGGPRDVPAYPSVALGAFLMSPIEVAQVYHSLSNGGYRTPLRTITSITDAFGNPVNRYPLESIKVISDEPYFLIIKAMQEVVSRGTASKLSEKISKKLNIAGKTGTTDDYRDSWFAGFSGNYLAIAWVGNDSNKRTGLSGNNGAMRVWMDVMKDIPLTPLVLNQPANVYDFPIDATNGLLMGNSCRSVHKTMVLPFIAGSEPTTVSDCYTPPPADDEWEEFDPAQYGFGSGSDW